MKWYGAESESLIYFGPYLGLAQIGIVTGCGGLFPRPRTNFNELQIASTLLFTYQTFSTMVFNRF